MLPVWHLALGWSTFSTPLVGLRHTYHVDRSFCDAIRFREAPLFTWRRLGCDAVHAAVRASIDAWQHNSPVSFVETSNASAATVLLSASATLEDGIVGQASRHVSLAEIELDDGLCWYADREFCHTVYEDRDLLHIVLSVVWILSLVALAAILCHPLVPYRGVTRLTVWSTALAIPLVYFGSMRACLECHDLASVLVHEWGHVLGLGHTDDVPQVCGCDDDGTFVAGECAPSTDTRNMMHGSVQRRPRACLARDDADGVRTLYSGVACSDPVWCYDTRDATGYARIAVAFAYAFCLSACAVGGRNAVVSRWRRAPPTHAVAHVVATHPVATKFAATAPPLARRTHRLPSV